ncbi:lauroyl acyltransferase [Acetobacteraceae bacterium H6797]|nr:lauroyl acyltransferase [Acetobacteraceae bacterium H6797]
MPRLSHLVEYAGARLALGLARLLGPVGASNLGGFVTRTLGPFLPAHRTAQRNLRLAFPEKSEAERAAILRAAWDNLGRSMAELPHLAALGPDDGRIGWTIEGEEQVAALRQGGAAVMLSAHLGNWELLTHLILREGLRGAGIYRAPDNPLVDREMKALRGGDRLPLFPKGPQGARQALKHLATGGVLALLADQRMSDGIAVPFFGHPAMTAPALAALALRQRCPVIPARTIRLGPARFRVVVEPPLPLPPEEMPREEAILALMTAVNERIEAWVRENPGQWLWQHRRWPKTAMPD